MPALDMDNPGVPAVATSVSLLKELLEQAEKVKQTSTIEPALNKSDFDDITGRVSQVAASLTGALTGAEDGESTSSQIKGRQYAMIETASREIFSNLIVSFATIPKLARHALTNIGDYHDRIPRLRQSVEPTRHPLDPLRRRTM